jgi:hypothetical protein
MAITDTETVRIGSATLVTVTSDLSGTIYYHWYLDGQYVGISTDGTWTFYLDEETQARVEVVDTNDADFDVEAGNPVPYPARRKLWWVRSLATDVAKYRAELNQDGGGWETIGFVQHDERQWTYELLTGRLDDLLDYDFRIVPIDTAGNDGTALDLDSETIVRTPDAPDFAVSFDEGTTKVTFTEAA